MAMDKRKISPCDDGRWIGKYSDCVYSVITYIPILMATSPNDDSVFDRTSS